MDRIRDITRELDRREEQRHEEEAREREYEREMQRQAEQREYEHQWEEAQWVQQQEQEPPPPEPEPPAIEAGGDAVSNYSLLLYCAEIDRLRERIAELERERNEARDEVEALNLRLSVLGGEACREERAAGNGPCGACAFCCAELRSENERLRGALHGLDADAKIQQLQHAERGRPAKSGFCTNPHGHGNVWFCREWVDGELVGDVCGYCGEPIDNWAPGSAEPDLYPYRDWVEQQDDRREGPEEEGRERDY